MSELINARDNRATIRWKLLTSASALALTAYVSCGSVARAEDTDRPTIWIELGGQMESVTGEGAPFAPTFLSVYTDLSVLHSPTPQQVQKPPVSFGEDGKISIQPEGSDWVFSAAARIGRSSNDKHVDHQTDKKRYEYHTQIQGPHGLLTFANFAETQAHHQETHTILDFSVGKDVGLGLFGKEASSTLSLGVRFAQFASKVAADIRARPDFHLKYIPYGTSSKIGLPSFHAYHATGHASRSFHGIGPSLSWNGSAPFVGNQHDGELTFDWGANASLLFGRQRADVRHQETAYHRTYLGLLDGNFYPVYYENPSRGHDNIRSVTVPNVGGSVALSWRVQDFKFNLGYRYDTFLKAMDTEIDARKTSNLTFSGPYASISVGLGN